MSSRISFIQQLFELGQDLSVQDSYARYLEMGRCCKLTDYMDSHAANYLGGDGVPWEDNCPFASGNGFITVNVEAGAADSTASPSVPFYSIAREGAVDTEVLREQVWQAFRQEGELLSCPVFMNEFALDKIVFRLRLRGGELVRADVVDLAAFDEDDDAMLKESASSVAEYMTGIGTGSFLYKWCIPFLDRDWDLWCDIRSVDRDRRFTAHSFYAVILPSLEEVREWHSAYGEDLMNVITIVKSFFIEDLHKAQLSEAIKSAISAIMSRNLSHNLGSHYLYYTKTYLENLAPYCGEKGPDVRGAAKVLSYMQARMDYLATIVSNDRYPAGAVNFPSQIFNEFTIDSYSRRTFRRYNERARRTTNFLLSNIVMSENFTRPGILRDNGPEGKFKELRVELKYFKDGRLCSAEEAAEELARLNVALPGGTMSSHAFFNILENFIRNSAKYLQADFSPEGLVITIAVLPRDGSYDFLVSDNKHNAARVLPKVEQQLEELCILDWKGAIDRSSKGLKEMLFSSVWMRPFSYPDKTFAEVINDIQTEIDRGEKLAKIRRYGFSFVSVGPDGMVREGTPAPSDCLGLLVNLPAFRFARTLDVDPALGKEALVKRLLDLSSDMVCLDMDREEAIRLGLPEYIARPYFEADFREEAFEAFKAAAGVLGGDESLSGDAFRFKSILDRRFAPETGGDFGRVCLWLGDRMDMRRLPRDPSLIVYFERHLSTRQEGLDPYAGYAAVDSVSGGNFTMTLKDQFEAGVTGQGKYRSWNDYILGLKIKESAMTRITLVDERLYNRMAEDGPERAKELSFKNIRVLTSNLECPHGGRVEDIFEGNAFRDGSARTHFLSIHLGLIEKVLQSQWGENRWKGEPVERKVACFMDELLRIFGGPDGDIHISIHSGRGNFSKELAGPLAAYPFISLSAIENAFSNSKFLLAQLFYNTLYIGKGIINH